MQCVLYLQESCAIAKMTARYADKSKQIATPPHKITWLSVDSIQPDIMDVGVERTFSPQNYSMFPGSRWATKSKDVGLIVRAISFQDFQSMWSWSTNVTDRRTDRLTDSQTTCDRKTALCSIVHRAVKTKSVYLGFAVDGVIHDRNPAFERRLQTNSPSTVTVDW